MGSNSVQGTFVMLNSMVSSETACNVLRDSLQLHSSVYAGISTLPNDCGVWARILAQEAVALRAALVELWRSARKSLVGSYPDTRRK